MASTSETGHAKNVANLAILITYTKGYGADYNPSNADITIPALQSLHTRAEASLSTVNKALALYGRTVSSRVILFKPLTKLVTRLVNAFIASKASEQAINNLKTSARKLKGTRAKKKSPPKADPNNPNAVPEDNSISVSQMSYDSRVNNFHRLIQTLKSEPKYKPNETDLQVTALENLYEEMHTKNALIQTIAVSLNNARMERNKILYDEVTGLVQTAKDTKNYIKSVYEASSPRYKQISGLSFRYVKD